MLDSSIEHTDTLRPQGRGYFGYLFGFSVERFRRNQGHSFGTALRRDLVDRRRCEHTHMHTVQRQKRIISFLHEPVPSSELSGNARSVETRTLN